MLFSLAYTRPSFVAVRKLRVVDVTVVDTRTISLRSSQLKYVRVTILQEAVFYLPGIASTLMATKLSSIRHRRQWQNDHTTIIVACGLCSRFDSQEVR